MLPFLSINVVHSELPDCLFQFWPNEVKIPECLNKRFQYLNFRAKILEFGNFEPNIDFFSWRKNSNISVYFSRQKGKKTPKLFTTLIQNLLFWRKNSDI